MFKTQAELLLEIYKMIEELLLEMKYIKAITLKEVNKDED